MCPSSDFEDRPIGPDRPRSHGLSRGVGHRLELTPHCYTYVPLHSPWLHNYGRPQATIDSLERRCYRAPVRFMTPGTVYSSRGRTMIASAAEVVATVAIALWLGGVLALGAFAAPVVFQSLELDTAGAVMGTIFARFDRLVVAVAVIIIASEVVRVACEGARGTIARARLAIAAVLVGLALVSSLWLGPQINKLFEAGVHRGIGAAGMEMDRLHRWASTAGKLAIAGATAWFALGVIMHRRRSSSAPHSALHDNPKAAVTPG